jgi:hypothetical protein
MTLTRRLHEFGINTTQNQQLLENYIPWQHQGIFQQHDLLVVKAYDLEKLLRTLGIETDDLLMKRHRELIDSSPPITLDGQPASINGATRTLATLRSQHQSVEFAWETVQRIIAIDGAFWSDPDLKPKRRKN